MNPEWKSAVGQGDRVETLAARQLSSASSTRIQDLLSKAAVESPTPPTSPAPVPGIHGTTENQACPKGCGSEAPAPGMSPRLGTHSFLLTFGKSVFVG